MKREGVRLAHERADVELDPRLYDSGGERHSRERGWRSIDRMIEDGVQFDAIFADDDLIALGALSALAAHGQQVPGDVSVVGYGGLPEARFSRPALTTVDVDFHQQGWLAGVILTRALKERAPVAAGQILLEAQLTVRESSVVQAASGRERLVSQPSL
jgi:LacI family transcriptional regulator